MQVDAGTAGNTINNTVSITAFDQTDTLPGNNSAVTGITVSSADLVVTNGVSNPVPNEGDTITYTITVTNGGPDAANNVQLTDLLPAGLTYVSDTPTQGTYNSGTGIWTVGNLANGANANMTLTATVDNGTAGSTINNSASVTASDQGDPLAGNNSATAGITVQAADLAVTNGVSNPIPNEGDSITYTITITNGGPDTATNIQLTDLCPAGLSYVSDTTSQGAYNSGTGLWNVGDIVNGAGATLTLTATVDNGTAGSTIDNTSSITAVDQADPVSGNNSSMASITIQSADLAVAVTVDDATPNEGDTIRYTITLTNNGPFAATNVDVTDVLPAGVTFTSSTASAGGYVSGTGIWTVANIANGASETLQIDATVDIGTSGTTINNSAAVTASDQGDTVVANNSATAAIIPNIPPVAVDDNQTATINTPVTFNVLANDSDSDGALDVTSVDLDTGTGGTQNTFTVAGEGTFTVDASGSVTFTPVAGFTGTCTVSYTVNDDLGTASNAANIIVTVEGMAVSGVLAEINATTITVNATAYPFNYDVLPTISPTDTGIDRVTIQAPAGYSNFNVLGVSVAGSNLTAGCPSPAAGQYCTNVAGQNIAVNLGTKVIADQTNIHVDFAADGPPAPGNADFPASVEDTGTAVAPQAIAVGNADGDIADDNSITVQAVMAVVPSRSTVTADPQVVLADGATTSTITVTLLDPSNNPVTNRTISLSSDRGATDSITQPASVTDANGVVTGTISSSTPGASTITVTDVTDGIVLSQQVTVYFSQGIVLQVDKMAGKNEIVVGEAVAYQVEIRNTTTNDITPARLDDLIPAGFKYLKGSARLNGAVTADPTGSQRLRFDLGTVPALVDTDANGQADPGEAGYMVLNYQLIAGSNVRPDTTYTNTAFSTDVCDNCLISNSDDADIKVVFDPTFDLGTIIGKVWSDKNRNGWQDKGEDGVAGVMVVLDDGTYVLTDEYGRYHIPAIKPGHRMLKINLRSLADGAEATTGETVVVQVTPGLLAKANFGVIYEAEVLQIGKPPEHGVALESKAEYEPIQVVGNADNLTVLINGEMAAIPTENVTLLVESLDEVIEFNGGKPDKPILFGIENRFDEKVSSWRMKIMDARGNPIRTLSGKGAPPKTISWNGQTGKGGRVKGGQIYQYQLQVLHKDGTRATSPRKLFGINQTTAISINLTGTAFITGSSTLGEKARAVLRETAAVLRKYPNEKIIIEGHTDNVGLPATNLKLSKQRAEAALEYLVRVEKIPEERFAVRWFGETRPITSNNSPETRALNRRIEIKGTMDKVERSKLYDQYRMNPTVKVNGDSVKLDSNGRFATQLSNQRLKRFRVQMVNPRGQSFDTTFNVPTIEILEPSGSVVLPVGTKGDGYRVAENNGGKKSDLQATLVKLAVKGRTDRGNTVTIDGRRLTVAPDGTFRTMLGLRRGNNPYGIIARNREGNTRIVNLMVTVNDSNELGDLIVATEPIPNLVVNMPPRGVALTSPILTIPGATDPGNRIEINGEPIAVAPDGTFTKVVKLKKGINKFQIFVIDPKGHVGFLPAEVEVKDTHLFFLAFGDAQLGYNMIKGNLKNAGAESKGEFFTEGRVAFYLKGVVKGKYMVTAALDTGRDELGKLFNNLDEKETDKLLTNLDPDKFYPVYGDDSTLVYDTQSLSKLYLALDSEDLKAMFGNYMLNLNDTELATYQRTLFGANASYTSVSRTQYGEPNTKIMIFGAEGEQVHVEDELLATGGSLYYLSHREVIEGSEQVTIVVRDQDTGLVLSRQIQQQNVDYTIKYDGGRILFSRPIASVQQDDQLINRDILPGNKVSIQVDYEARTDTLEKIAYGGRVRQQIGDHVAVGGTYVKDELDADYELQGVDAEVRLGKNTRVTAEYAQSEGVDAETFFSDDGGVTFVDTTGSSIEKGAAYKFAAELDIGEWFDKPGHYQIGGYYRRQEPGFSSTGNNAQSGTDKSGVDLFLKFTKRDTIRARYDIVKNEATVAVVETQSDIGTFQYAHQHGWWAVTLEYQNRGEKIGSGAMERDSYAAAKFSVNATKDLKLSAQHQQTITGVENNQTTVGLKYQLLENLGIEATATTGTIGNSAQGGAVLKVGDDKTVYLNQRLTEDATGRTTATILGSEALIGKKAKVYSEYQWERKNDDQRNISLIGAERTWEAFNGLKLLLSGEYAAIDATSGDLQRTALAGGLSYANAAGLQFTTRQEVRLDDGTDEKIQFLTNNILKYKFKQDFTFFGKIRYSRTENVDLDEVEAMFNEYVIGIAYRPVAFDRFNALAKYTRLGQSGPDDAGTMAAFVTDSDVASVEWSLDITRRIEWVEKLAYRLTTEQFGSLPEQTSHTFLNINRLNINVWRNIDLGLEYRIRHQQEADDMRTGFLTEVMWEPVDHFRFGVGYNFTDFSDNEFSDNDYSVSGAFTRFQFTW